MTLELVCRAEVLGGDEEGVFVATSPWQRKPQLPARAMQRPPTTRQRQPQPAGKKGGRKLQNRRDFDRVQKRARTRVKVFFCEEERQVG